MELAHLITWAIGLAVTAMMAFLGRLAAASARNGRETAELRGRVDAMERVHSQLSEELRNVHHRVGGVARTTDQIAGQMLQIGNTLTIMHEHLLQREKSS